MKTVYTSTGLKGTVIENLGSKSIVDFNGTQKTMLNILLKDVAPKSKVKNYMKEEIIETKDSFNSIVSNLEGSKNQRHSMLFFGENIYSTIEKLADSQNHFAGSIIEDARNGKTISKKQAQVVAFFVKENGLI